MTVQSEDDEVTSHICWKKIITYFLLFSLRQFAFLLLVFVAVALGSVGDEEDEREACQAKTTCKVFHIKKLK